MYLLQVQSEGSSMQGLKSGTFSKGLSITTYIDEALDRSPLKPLYVIPTEVETLTAVIMRTKFLL